MKAIIGTLALLMAFAINSAHATLITHYTFNGNADDASGNNNHGTVHGAVLTADRFGNADSAYYFDGSNDYIAASASGLPTGTRTVSLWFNAASVTNRPVMMGYGGGSCGTSFFLGMNARPSIYNNRYYVSSHCDVNTLASEYTSEPINIWQHMAVTTDINGTKIYIDGIEVASDNNFINNTIVNGKDLIIGSISSPSGFGPYDDGNIGYFKGMLDDIRIYDTALSAQEIARLAGSVAVPAPSTLLLLAGAFGIMLSWRQNNRFHSSMPA